MYLLSRHFIKIELANAFEHGYTFFVKTRIHLEKKNLHKRMQYKIHFISYLEKFDMITHETIYCVHQIQLIEFMKN